MNTSNEKSIFSRFYGVALLVFVNIVWVTASEVTRYLFIDLDFKRPFFFTYAKSCMLSLFLSVYCCEGRKSSSEAETTSTTSKSGKAFYSRLTEHEHSNSSCEESDEEEDEIIDCNSLTEAEFEPISATDMESNTGELSAPESQTSQTTPELKKSEKDENVSSTSIKTAKRIKRRVRFSKLKEVRRWPESLSEAATLARLPYNKAKQVVKENFCSNLLKLLKLDTKSNLFIYSMYFAPLWLVSSVSYQTALAYSSVSTVNLISASSPLFVLIFGAFFGKYSVDSFSWLKLLMVLLNMLGVCIVSRFSGNLFTTSLSLFSAFSNAIYLFALARLSFKGKNVNMPLLLGTVGLFSLFACSPLIYIAHISGFESQLPLPTFKQMSVLIANAFLGTLFADSIWLYATLLTGSLTSSLSGSLGVPLSLLADSFFRNQPPNFWQIVASVPIMISFFGASILTTRIPES